MLLFAEGAHHLPVIVEFVNHYLGEPIYKFEKAYTEPTWNKYILSHFGTTAEQVFGPYTPETAIPWYTVMFAIACILTIGVIWLLKGKLSEDAPKNGQLTLEAGYLTVHEFLMDIVGDHAGKYFPVVATFAVLILVSNLMGFFPLFMAPTASTSVTFALALTSFFYYNYIGIKENGIGAHLGHLAGPIWWMAWFIFPLELISNLIRPMSLGVRLFGNIFADEQVSETVSGLAATLHLPEFLTQLLVPIPLMFLGLLVCFVQTLVFTLLSMIYLSEVSHADGHRHDHEEAAPHGEPVHA